MYRCTQQSFQRQTFNPNECGETLDKYWDTEIMPRETTTVSKLTFREIPLKITWRRAWITMQENSRSLHSLMWTRFHWKGRALLLREIIPVLMLFYFGYLRRFSESLLDPSLFADLDLLIALSSLEIGVVGGTSLSCPLTSECMIAEESVIASPVVSPFRRASSEKFLRKLGLR